MKVAIIGANGFIGSRLVECFHLGGKHTPVPIVRQPSSLALPARFAVDWRLGDALDPESLKKALTGCDAVVHAAIGDPRQIEQMPEVLALAAASASIPRVVYLSSASVHGQNIRPGTTESTRLSLSQALDYNTAKVKAERSFFASCTKYRVSGYALRPGVVYGPRSRWISDLADEFREGRAWLYAEGSGICNSIYVDNLISAIERCLENEGGAMQAYLVGDAETVTWSDFYLEAAKNLGASPSTIQAVRELPRFQKSFRERVEKTVAQPWVQKMLPAVPFKWKRATKTVLATWNPPPSPNAWSVPPKARPKITHEMAMLQQNRWKIPNDKAAKILGYNPPVAFPEAMRRSFAWLKFATQIEVE